MDIQAVHKRYVVAGFARHFAILASSDASEDQLKQTMGHLLDALTSYSQHLHGIQLPPPLPAPKVRVRPKIGRWRLFVNFLRGGPPQTNRQPRAKNGVAA